MTSLPTFVQIGESTEEDRQEAHGGSFDSRGKRQGPHQDGQFCRQMTKLVVKNGLSDRCLVQLSYAIGVT